MARDCPPLPQFREIPLPFYELGWDLSSRKRLLVLIGIMHVIEVPKVVGARVE